MVDFDSASVPDRYVTRDATTRLNTEFGFVPDAYMQDWEIELSDGSRLDEFVNAYTRLDLSDDERFALMALIVASADDALDFHVWDTAVWSRIHDLLVSDSAIHAQTIHYWCCADATCEDEYFSLTPRMRDVWRSAFGSK